MFIRCEIVKKIAARWRMVLAVVVCLLASFAGMRQLNDKLALSKLEKQIDQEISHDGFFYRESQNMIPRILEGAVEWTGLRAPDWLTTMAKGRNDMPPHSTDLIASSRWPIRRAMADSIIRNDKRAEFLMEQWKEYLPAIIGADVTLAHRREWISDLNTLRMDASLPTIPRQAAVFYMALVILTDPPEFENWRVLVRDAMLGKPELLWIEDVWMRTLDTLLAIDPPESWGALTKPLTVSHDQFLSAMTVPVRGTVGNFDALLREFEFFESNNDPEHASDLWHGAGASMAAWPHALGESESAKIRDWRRDILFEWLMNRSDLKEYELIHSKNLAPVEFTPEQQHQLAVTAANWSRLASEKIDSTTVHAKWRVTLVKRIYPHLTNRQQAEIGHLLIPVMLRPDLFISFAQKSIRFDSDWMELAWKIQPLMSNEERKTLQIRLTPMMANLYPLERSSAVLLCMDAWSDVPTLSPEKWLALAWQFRCDWLIVPRNTPRESLDPFTGDPLPVPPLTDSVVEALAKHLEATLSTDDLNVFTKTFNDSLNGNDSSPQVSAMVTRSNYNMIRNWKSCQALASHSVAELLEMALYRCGLRELNGSGLPALKALMKSKQDYYSWWPAFNNPGNRIDPWSEVRMNPQEATRWIGNEDNVMMLEIMLMCMEKFPPDAAIARAIWDEMRKRSRNADIKKKAPIYGTLFRLSRWLPREERLNMRKDFLADYRTKKFKSSAGDNDIYDWDLSPGYLGGGLGIPWEDDELSATLSWQINFKRQVCLCPPMKLELYANDVFSFLALGSYREPVWNQKATKAPTMPRLSTPFEPTPWQRARELHRRHPHLDQ